MSNDKLVETIGLWPKRPSPAGLSLTGKAAQDDARAKSATAGAKRMSETERRLIRVDGDERILHEVATAVGVSAARLAAWYAKGMRSMKQFCEAKAKAVRRGMLT